MYIPEKIFKSYDIRGIYPNELNEENAVEITKAIYKFLTKDYASTSPFKFAIAHDMRISSPSLYKVVTETLVSLGAEVHSLGLLPTPSFYFAVSHFNLDGGFVISASHNPKEYNGMKIVKRTPEGILKIGKSTGMDEIKRLSIEDVDLEMPGNGTIIEESGILQEEVKNALNLSGNPELKPFKVVADTANAMGAVYLEELFKNIPGELVRMNFELDGSFPVHQADPLQPENLVELQRRVVEEGADIGLAPDGDGDRMFTIDEKGGIVPPSIVTSIIAKELLKENPGATIIADIRYLINARENVTEAGGKLSVSKVGHAFITEQLQKEGAIFAGESSAHYFFKNTGGAEAQLPIVITLLKVMTRENKPLSEIVKMYQRCFESGEINFEVDNAKEIMDKVKGKFTDAEISELDGVAISYPDTRISLRSSNTEPLLRLNIESKDEEKMEEIKQAVLKLVKGVSSE